MKSVFVLLLLSGPQHQNSYCFATKVANWVQSVKASQNGQRKQTHKNCENPTLEKQLSYHFLANRIPMVRIDNDRMTMLTFWDRRPRGCIWWHSNTRGHPSPKVTNKLKFTNMPLFRRFQSFPNVFGCVTTGCCPFQVISRVSCRVSWLFLLIFPIFVNFCQFLSVKHKNIASVHSVQIIFVTSVYVTVGCWRDWLRRERLD